MSSPIYHFWAEIQDLVTHIQLNDVELLAVPTPVPGQAKQSAEDISLWIRPGANTLQVKATLPPNIELSQAHLRAIIQQAPRSNPRGAKQLWELDWSSASHASPPPWTTTATLQCTSPSRFWSEATPLSLDGPTRAQLQAFALDLVQLFRQGDPQRLAQRLDYRARDIGRVLEFDAQTAIARQLQFLQAIMGAPGFAVDPVPEDAVTISLVAGGTVAWLRNRAEPLLLSRQGQGMDVYVARIQGSWVIVR